MNLIIIVNCICYQSIRRVYNAKAPSTEWAKSHYATVNCCKRWLCSEYPSLLSFTETSSWHCL